MHINFSKTRHFFVFAVIIVLFSAIFARLLYVQIIRHEFLSKLADRQHKIFIKLEPHRGNIYDRLGRVLAIYLDSTSFYAVPREIHDKEEIAGILASDLNMDKGELLRRFNRNNNFAWVKRKLDSKPADRIKALNLKGIYAISEDKRFYPGEKLACHTLGLTGIDNKGLEGIELYYDKDLSGEYGWRYTERDAKQREIASFEIGALPPRDGNSLVLTIDEVIQHIIEKEIENIVKLYSPVSVSIVALRPATGEVLGLANYPQFDPNDVPAINMDFVRNRAISDVFEPGSVFKIVTASAAMEEEAVDFDTEFFCENGAYKIGKRTLRDYRPYGNLTFRKIIEKSSNIGTVKVAGKLGKERLSLYIKKFNFGKPTGIDLPGESGGIMREARNWSYVDMTTIPMGQGIAVTPLQMVSSVSAIANEGVLMRPYILKQVFDEEGVPVRETRPRPIRRVISKKTADKIKELLKGVIEEGTGSQAKLDNFIACGKTGTAEKVNPGVGYYADRYIASFIGFAPYDKPAMSLIVSVDEPKGKHFGGQVAAPAFKNIMENALSYMGIKGDRDEVKKTS